MAYEDEALGWGEEVIYEGEPDFEPVPPGTYAFEVVGFERQMHNGSEKMGPCPVAKVEVRLLDAPREAHVFERFFLSKKTLWKIAQFFTSVGLFSGEKGAPFRPDWGLIPGTRGRAEVGTRVYKGKTYNEVGRWLKPDAPQAAPAYQPQQAVQHRQQTAQPTQPTLPVQAPQGAYAEPRPPVPWPSQQPQPGSF